MRMIGCLAGLGVGHFALLGDSETALHLGVLHLHDVLQILRLFLTRYTFSALSSCCLSRAEARSREALRC